MLWLTEFLPYSSPISSLFSIPSPFFPTSATGLLNKEIVKIEKWNDPKNDNNYEITGCDKLVDCYIGNKKALDYELLDVESKFNKLSSSLKKSILEKLEELYESQHAIFEESAECNNVNSENYTTSINLLAKNIANLGIEREATKKLLDDVEFEIKSYNEYKNQKLLEIEEKNNKNNSKEKNKGNDGEEEEEKQGWIPNQAQGQIQSQIKSNKNNRAEAEEEKKGFHP